MLFVFFSALVWYRASSAPISLASDVLALEWILDITRRFCVKFAIRQ